MFTVIKKVLDYKFFDLDVQTYILALLIGVVLGLAI